MEKSDPPRNRFRFVVLAVFGSAWISSLVALSQSPLDDDSPRKPTLRVLTYNIHHGEGTDGKIDLDRIASIIKSAKPDLVAIQEVDVKTKRSKGIDQAQELAKRTGLHGKFGRAIDFQDGEYGQVVLSRFPILEFRTVELPNEAGREQRIAAIADVRLGEKGPRIQFVSTHFDHQREDLREKQAAKLDTLLGKVEHPVIIAGDLNATSDSRTLRTLGTNWQSASRGQPLPTIPVEKPLRQIDFVLYRPADKFRTHSAEVLEESVASDHRPLLIVLEFPD